MKLFYNAAYGKTLLNNVSYTHGEDTSKLVNGSQFKKLTEIANDLNEVEWQKRRFVKISLSFLLSMQKWVCDAKLRMLQFYYDLLDRFIARVDFPLCEMDTDKTHLALSKRTIAVVVKPDILKQFYQVYRKCFPREIFDDHQADITELSVLLINTVVNAVR